MRFSDIEFVEELAAKGLTVYGEQTPPDIAREGNFAPWTYYTDQRHDIPFDLFNMALEIGLYEYDSCTMPGYCEFVPCAEYSG